MPISPRENSLDSLLKEVRLFKVLSRGGRRVDSRFLFLGLRGTACILATVLEEGDQLQHLPLWHAWQARHVSQLRPIIAGGPIDRVRHNASL